MDDSFIKQLMRIIANDPKEKAVSKIKQVILKKYHFDDWVELQKDLIYEDSLEIATLVKEICKNLPVSCEIEKAFIKTDEEYYSKETETVESTKLHFYNMIEDCPYDFSKGILYDYTYVDLEEIDVYEGYI
jgi:hypothetical protein